MGVRLYKRGEHPAGFIGFRVTLPYGGKYKQKYFSTNGMRPDSIEFEMQEMKARLQEAEWQMESLLWQYQTFVTTNHPNTKPGRGVGVHCITLNFFTDRRDKWTPAFVVQNEISHPVRFTFAQQTYSETWEQAVTKWAEWHSIEDKDRDRVLANRPDPTRFKELRRIMVDEGFDIPVEALRPVFKEQREKLKAMQAKPTAQRSYPGLPNVDQNVAQEVEAWFHSVAGK